MDKETLWQKVYELFGAAYSQGAHSHKTKWWMKSDTDEVFSLFEKAGYRKLTEKPPLVEIPFASDFIDEDAIPFVNGYSAGAMVQRDTDWEYFKGESNG